MVKRNQTAVTEFILLGFTSNQQLEILLFLLFLQMYIFTLVCNFGIFTLVTFASQLHKPMYFFLTNLSLSDFCFSSVTVPKLLKDLLSEKKSISYTGCAAQTFFLVLFAALEVYLLSAMAYDRYAAICHPLLYYIVINRSVCIQLVTGVYILGIITAAGSTIATFHDSFCNLNVIDHFYCEVPPLMKLSCYKKFIRELGFFAMAFTCAIGPLTITVTSYMYIISTILQIPSTAGRFKTFSTCGSHLTALCLFYGTAMFMYLQLPGSGSGTQNKVVSVCYTIVIPMLNPLIYCFRNQEFKGVMRIIIYKKRFCFKY